MVKKLNKKSIKIMGVLLGVLSCCFIFIGCSSDDTYWELTDDKIIETTDKNDWGTEEDIECTSQDVLLQPKIIVFVCGEVNKPGVYELNADCRLFEAVEAAGGMTENADKNYQNLARIVQDGEQIIIPDKESSVSGDKASMNKQSKLININNADVKELTSISGIGESRATAIIMYREQHGKFKRIEDIKNVDGIKDSLFQKIKDQITV